MLHSDDDIALLTMAVTRAIGLARPGMTEGAWREASHAIASEGTRWRDNRPEEAQKLYALSKNVMSALTTAKGHS